MGSSTAYDYRSRTPAAVLREPGKPTMALMVTPDAERKYVGSAFITLNHALRERVWERVQAGKGKTLTGMTPQPAAEFLRPGTIGRVRHLKGEEKRNRCSQATALSGSGA
jgi:bifunctional non-homologous end joining protein LigD